MGLNLIGRVELDGAGFERGLRRAGDSVTGFVKSAAVAAFGFVAVEQAIKKTVESASDLVNESKRLDLTVEQLQLLRQAAKDAGTDIGTVASALEKIDLARAKALSGDKTAMAAFTSLGVTPDQLKNQAAGGIFTGSLANAAKNNSVESIAPAMREILGKGFGEVMPVLKTDFDELGDSIKKVSGFMDAETAVKLKALGDKFDLIGNILVVGLGPALVKFGDVLVTVTGLLKQAFSGFSAASKDGVWKGIGSFSKELNDSVINLVPGKVGDMLQDMSDQWYKTFFDLTPKEATENVLAAGVAAQSTSDEWDKFVAKMHKDLDDAAKALENPKPPGAGNDLASAQSQANKAFTKTPTDALVKVGNFLGSNGNVISRVEQQKVQLLTRIANGVEKQSQIQSGLGTFGLGVPMT